MFAENLIFFCDQSLFMRSNVCVGDPVRWTKRNNGFAPSSKTVCYLGSKLSLYSNAYIATKSNAVQYETYDDNF